MEGPVSLSLQLYVSFRLISFPSNVPSTSKLASVHFHSSAESLALKEKLKETIKKLQLKQQNQSKNL